MSESTKYNLGSGRFDTQVEIIKSAYNHSNTLKDPKARKSYIETIEKQFAVDISSAHMNNRLTTTILPIIAGILLLVIYVTVLFLPAPTYFQSATFWLILSLGAAGLAALIPGFINVRFKNLIRAGGAISVFVITYLVVPKIVESSQSNSSTEKIPLFVLTISDSTHLQKLFLDVNPNNSQPIVIYACEILKSYYGQTFSPNEFTFYRRSDGKIYSLEACNKVIKDGSVLMIHQLFTRNYPDKRQAFIHYKDLEEK